jgi:malonyl-CoA decarboxylase
MSSEVPEIEPVSEETPSRLTALERTFHSVLDAGREILARRKMASSGVAGSLARLVSQCRELLDHRGEASGLALASEVTRAYRALPENERPAFYQSLLTEFDVDRQEVLDAAERYRQQGDADSLASIARSVEAPRQKLFRRINMAPDGTASLVAMRGDLLPYLKTMPQLRPVDSDLKHLFISWFNKGFLELRQISWDSPASVLEKIIDYEAVHEINGWEDLRNRLRDDRRCFAFFHPALNDDPLVFVEIALTDSLPDAIAPLLQQERDMSVSNKPSTVVFYSISNCHPGLAGVSFGNFLIKNVVEELSREMPWLRTFVTLSPVPGFCRWLQDADLSELVPEHLQQAVREPVGSVIRSEVYEAHIRLCAYYLMNVKSGALPRDPVARFHLGNGARLHRIHGGADLSPKGRKQSAGIMVNYLYDLTRIEVNHEAFFDEGKISASRSVTRLLS